MHWSRQLVIGAALSLSAVLSPKVARHSAHAQEAAAQPQLLMAALQLPGSVRYTLTLANPTQTTLGDLQLSVQLPDDAVFDHALETPGFTQFQGMQAGSLSWSAASFAPTDVVDAFSFFLQQPTTGGFTVSASWDGDGAGQVQSQFQPSVQQAVETDADVTLDATTLTQGFTPVGNTGVVIAAVSGAIPAGTTVHFSVLSADNNPDATVGDLWWCAEVEVDGLPAGTGLVLQVPARQPLPPLAPISLFAQNGAQWQALPNAATVTGDGQSIQYLHQGGVIASGTGSVNQPRLPSGVTVSVARLPIPLSAIALAAAQSQLVNLMQQNCQTAFNPNLPAPPPGSGGTRSCTNRAGGTTTCLANGTRCGGNVPLLAVPGGVPLPANPGHGTACTFPDIFTVFPFSCGQF